MKLVRYGEPGREKPGLVHDNSLRDISHLVPDLDRRAPRPRLRWPKSRPSIRAACRSSAGQPRLGACVGRPCNFIAVGLNFADHAAETGAPIPKEPILFNKTPNCIVGPNDNVMLPKAPRRPTGRSNSPS